MHCVSCVTIGLLGFISDKCSFVVAFVDGLFIYGCTFLRFDYLKDEYWTFIRHTFCFLV